MSTTAARDQDDVAARGADRIVDAVGVTLRFGGVTSLADVSMHQLRGEVLAVIGPNGAGKTSLFNCLTGVYRPQLGSIVFTPVAGRTRSLVGRRPHAINRAGIARTFQTTRLFNALSAFENVKVGVEAGSRTGPIGAILHLPRATREDRETDRTAHELLEFVGLAAQANVVAGSLAYGDKRRLEIARALGTGPELLLLDEPAAGTNPTEKVALSELIRRVNVERGISVLLIEHDMRLVMSIATRIYVLNFGRLIAEGTASEIQSNPTVLEAYLGTVKDSRGAADRGDAADAPDPRGAP